MTSEIKTKLWVQKAIAIYELHVCDISFDHISIQLEADPPRIYHIQELGYEECPECKSLAPLVNFNFHEPKTLIKMCDCGYEVKVNRPQLFRAYSWNQ